jgi:hypothetical protein
MRVVRVSSCLEGAYARNTRFYGAGGYRVGLRWVASCLRLRVAVACRWLRWGYRRAVAIGGGCGLRWLACTSYGCAVVVAGQGPVARSSRGGVAVGTRKNPA